MDLSPTPLMSIEPVGGGVLAPLGFEGAAAACGIKVDGALDVALVCADRVVSAAAVFTRNTMAAAPVKLSKRHVADGTARAVIVNSGNANACTGLQGERDALRTSEVLAGELGVAPEDIIVCSTGVIGVPLPVARLEHGVRAAVADLSTSAGDEIASAIMTTDTYPKQHAVRVSCDGTEWTVGGVAKGSGMIAPNMATMLAVITTDAPLEPAACSAVLRSAVDVTFNRITVDGDTSTNDTCVLLASGAAGGEAIDEHSPFLVPVRAAVEEVCSSLARMIVADGEGATKTVDVTVTGAITDADALAAAHSIARSPLVKTALFGGDANWGRVVMALGNSSAALDPARVSVRFAGVLTCEHGMGLEFDEDAAARGLAQDEVSIEVDLGIGRSSATVTTCDLSYEYVRINGEYRT